MDLTWTETLLSLGIGVGLAAATGFRVFVPLLVMGIAARLEWLQLSDGFSWLASVPAIAGFSIATLVEVAAYYTPVIDNVLDVLAGPLAIAAGVLTTAAVTTDMPPALRWSFAIVAGGGTAGLVQGLTSILRLKSTVFTAGLGNFLVATLELVGSLIASLIAILLPIIAIGVVAVLVVVFFVARKRHSGLASARVRP
jgi:hypothetical protein